jgi:hypothetical protein
MDTGIGPAHTKVFQVIEGKNIPDGKKFLSVKENKQALINFFGDFIVKFNQSNPLVPTGNLYYIAGSFGNPEIVNVVSDQEVFDCPDLYSTQEEADTVSLTDRNFFPSGIFLPSMTWNTFVWAVTLVRRSLSADLIDFFRVFFTSYRSNTSATVCVFAKHDVNCLQ